jgi:predicted transcriptional regulator of viral defense system
MSIPTELEMLIKKNNGIISTAEAQQAGVNRAGLSKLVVLGELERTSRGNYVITGAIDDEMFSLQKRAKKIVFSHETALFLHGLSDRTPFRHSITVPNSYKPSQHIKDICKIYYIKPELAGVGLTTAKTSMGNKIMIYDIERTICDVVRSRNKMDTQIVIDALKRYVLLKSADMNKLHAYAMQFSVYKILQQYLEVLL